MDLLEILSDPEDLQDSKAMQTFACRNLGSLCRSVLPLTGFLKECSLGYWVESRDDHNSESDSNPDQINLN